MVGSLSGIQNDMRRQDASPGEAWTDRCIPEDDAETGLSILGQNRADFRFDDSTVKITTGRGNGPLLDDNGLAIDLEGKVGLGTTTPTSALQVASGGISITSNSAHTFQSGVGLFLDMYVGSAGWILAYDYRRNAHLPLLLNTPDGDVAVGVSVPSAKVHVESRDPNRAAVYSVVGELTELRSLSRAIDQGGLANGEFADAYGWFEPDSSASIRLMLPADPGRIDAGKAYVEISGWFGGFATQGDTALMEVTFLDGAGAPVESFSIGSPKAADRQFQTGLLFDCATQAIPVGVREAEVVLTMRREVNTGYSLSFALGTLQESTDFRGPVSVIGWVNSVTNEWIFQPESPGNAWKTFSMDFTATSTVTTLAFLGAQSSGGTSIGLDDIDWVPIEDPGDTDLKVVVSRSGLDPNALELRFPTVAARRYSVQTAPVLGMPIWTVVEGIERIGTGDPMEILVPLQRQETQRFYRLQVGP